MRGGGSNLVLSFLDVLISNIFETNLRLFIIFQRNVQSWKKIFDKIFFI